MSTCDRRASHERKETKLSSSSERDPPGIYSACRGLERERECESRSVKKPGEIRQLQLGVGVRLVEVEHPTQGLDAKQPHAERGFLPEKN